MKTSYRFEAARTATASLPARRRPPTAAEHSTSRSARLGGALLYLLGTVATPATAGNAPTLTPPVWQPVAPGIEFCRVEAPGAPRGGGIAAVRLDPARCRIEPYHERDFPGKKPATIEGWSRRLAAPVVFNAGLYREDRTHLGILRREGEDVGGSLHRVYKAILVSGSIEPGLPEAAIYDLSVTEEEHRALRYPNAVQSMMLFDRHGVIRVRRTDRAAPRTAVALDLEGRLLVLVTEGSHTLWDLAEILRGAGWNLASAMALDGGREANLAVEAPGVSYRTHQAEVRGERDPYFREGVTLPAVVAVWPKAPDS